jgi:hypothetical protein
MDRQAALGCEHAAGRAGGKEIVPAERPAIVGGPLEKVGLEVVVCDERNPLAPAGHDRSVRRGARISKLKSEKTEISNLT